MTIKLDPAGLPRLIGLNSNRERAGKDTMANYLVEKYGYVKLGWADALRACCHTLNPIVGYDTLGPIRWTQLFDELGYEAAKDHPEYGHEFRRVMLVMGTEVGRDILGENVWVNLLLDKLEPDRRYVIADTRFPNEAEALTERDGAVVRIIRPGKTRINHASEGALDLWEFDAIIANAGTLEDFYEAIDAWLEIVPLGPPVTA